VKFNRVLIIGSSGNIGKSLASSLEEYGHQVTRASRHGSEKRKNHIYLNLEERIDDSSISSKYDYAFLCYNMCSAGENCSPKILEKNNAVTTRLIKILNKKGIKVGFFSSAAVFDGLTPESESSDRKLAKDPYGVAKTKIENFLLDNNIESDIYRTGKILGKLPVIDKWISQCNQKMPISIFPNGHISPLSSSYLATAICEKFSFSDQPTHQISGSGDVSYLSLYNIFRELRRSKSLETCDSFDILGTEAHFESLKLSGMFSALRPPFSLDVVAQFLEEYVFTNPR
jgi:dTDP-4-dehydrorhamnose reductase